MLASEAVRWLLDEGYAERNQVGIVRVVKAPKLLSPTAPRKDRVVAERDLHTFVACLIKIGACSTGDNRTINLSRGCEGDEVVFQLAHDPCLSRRGVPQRVPQLSERPVTSSTNRT